MSRLIGPPHVAQTATEIPDPLTGEDLVDWLALSRVRSGTVVRDQGRWYDEGLPMPFWLLRGLMFDALLNAQLIELGERSEHGIEIARLTPTGRSKLNELAPPTTPATTGLQVKARVDSRPVLAERSPARHEVDPPMKSLVSSAPTRRRMRRSVPVVAGLQQPTRQRDGQT